MYACLTGPHHALSYISYPITCQGSSSSRMSDWPHPLVMTSNDQSRPICVKVFSNNTFGNACKSFEVLQDCSWENANHCMPGLKGQLHVWILAPQLPYYPTTPFNDCKWPVWPFGQFCDKVNSGVSAETCSKKIFWWFCESFDMDLQILVKLQPWDVRLPRNQPWNELCHASFFMLALSGK